MKLNPTGLPEAYVDYAYDYRFHECPYYEDCLAKVSTRKLKGKNKYPDTWACHNCEVPNEYGIIIPDITRIKVTKKCVDCDTPFDVSIRFSLRKIRCDECRIYDNVKDDCACGAPKDKHSKLCYACSDKLRVDELCSDCGETFKVCPNRRYVKLCDKCKKHRAYLRRKERKNNKCVDCGTLIYPSVKTTRCFECYNLYRRRQNPRRWCACGNPKITRAKTCVECHKKNIRHGVPSKINLICPICTKDFVIDYKYFYEIYLYKRELLYTCCSLKCSTKLANRRRMNWIPENIRIPCARKGCKKTHKRITAKVLGSLRKGQHLFCSRSCASKYIRKSKEERLSFVKGNWEEKVKQLIDIQRTQRIESIESIKNIYVERGYFDYLTRFEKKEEGNGV